MSGSLFGSARPASDDTASDEMFRPLTDDEVEEREQEQGWRGDTMPARWLFEDEARGKLVEYAVTATLDNDLVFRNKSELAEEAGVSRHSVHRHMDDLVDIGIYEERGEGIARYRPDEESRILAAINHVNEAIEKHDLSL